MMREMNKKSSKKSNSQCPIDARLVTATDEEWESTNKHLCANIFKDKETISFKEFNDMRHK